MGGKKKNSKLNNSTEKQQPPASKEGEDEKRFVNLLHVYTVYKQRCRRLNKEDFETLLWRGSKDKKATVELCKEFMKAKQISDDVRFEKNVGFLSVPRFLPLIALLAERAGYNIKPSLVSKVNFTKTPERFQKKFSYLMVHGFWFLGRVITDSLSVKEQVNRGNVFNFIKGDMGFWWAGVKILDWNCCVQHINKKPLGEADSIPDLLELMAKAKKISKPETCEDFIIRDHPRFRVYSDRAMTNMHSHPLRFLSALDWTNFTDTVRTVRHQRVPVPIPDDTPDSEFFSSDYDSYDWSTYDSESVISSLSSGPSANTWASGESVD